MGTLTITFSGICTHFHDCLPWDQPGPKIPMRSVLPNASGSTTGGFFGLVSVLKPPFQDIYVVMPHTATAANAATNPTLSSVLTGAKLEVLRVDERQPRFSLDGDGYHLSNYVDAIEPSPSLLQDAACYVDFFYGTGVVKGTKGDPKSSLTTVVTIETHDDVPQVQFSPFSGDPFVWETNQLFVANQDVHVTPPEYKYFDFLGNYLTTSSGIPGVLTQPTPGMTDTPKPLTPLLLADRLRDLSDAIRRLGPNFTVSPPKWYVPLDESCSDSHVP
ncbi:MAG TPA: hypothetical protein VNN25_24750 [Thermoanaerobaculia bacterium]|nr:hypothetical protein [Thermoanaerobaculia bacterium]